MDRVLQELEAVIIGGAGERIHLNVRDGGGEVEGLAESLEGHVEGDVDEVLLRRPGRSRPREVEERLHAQRWVERVAASRRDSTSRLPGPSTAGGLVPQPDHQCGRYRRCDDQKEGEGSEEEEPPSPGPA